MSGEDTFEDAPQGGIKDLIKKAKKDRQNKKPIFMRSFMEFFHLVKDGQPRSLLEEAKHSIDIRNAYEVLVQAFEVWEKSHREYADLVGLTINAEGEFYDSPINLYSEAQVMLCQTFCNEREREEEGHFNKRCPENSKGSKSIGGGRRSASTGGNSGTMPNTAVVEETCLDISIPCTESTTNEAEENSICSKSIGGGRNIASTNDDNGTVLETGLAEETRLDLSLPRTAVTTTNVSTSDAEDFISRKQYSM